MGNIEIGPQMFVIVFFHCETWNSRDLVAARGCLEETTKPKQISIVSDKSRLVEIAFIFNEVDSIIFAWVKYLYIGF